MLAHRLGVSKQAVYSWFNGQSKPKLETIFKIAKVLDMNHHDIIKEFYGNGDEEIINTI